MANKYTNRDLWEYNFNENDYANLVKSAQNKASAESAVANYGPFKYGRQQDYDNALNAKLNQGKFSYDINGDVLYQQYKDNYINQGKQAMVDTMGQAAAMTGGYGNSYAATVGNQTYQGYLTNLNNMIPQLQQMALDRYNAESNRLSENFNILGLDRQNALSEYESGYSKLVADRDYYGTDYANTYKNTLDLYNNQFTANNDAYWNEYNMGYKKEQDEFANDLALKQYNLQKDAQTIAEKQAGVVRDNDGKIVSVGTTASPLKAPDDKMMEGVLEAYESGGIKAMEAFINKYSGDEYDLNAMAEYAEQYGTLPLEMRTFTKTKDTRNAGFLGLTDKDNSGVDHNDVVEDQYGNEYKISDLKDLGKDFQLALTKLAKDKKYTKK